MYLFPKTQHHLLSAVIHSNTSFNSVHNNTDPVFAITGEIYDENDKPENEYYEIEVKNFPEFIRYVNNCHLSVQGKSRFLSLLFLNE